MSQSINLNLSIPRFIFDSFFNENKYTCIAAGRRTGKTYNAAMWILSQLMASKNKSGLWVDTTQRNLTEYVDIYFKKILGEVWKHIKYDKQGHKVEFPNGSFLHLRSAERPENMEGFEYDYIVCNEAGIIFKSSTLWTNTVMPMAKNAQVKFVGTPKGKNYFETLFLAEHTAPEWKSYQFTAYDSPYWLDGQLESIKRDPSIDNDIWEQEYLGKFIATTSNVICKRTHKASWRDDDDKPYTLEHDWIQRQLNDNGYYFISFDGGMHTTHSAAILGFHNERFNRDIILKEFYNEIASEGIHEVAMQVKDYLLKNDIEDIRLYGDPALKTYNDSETIKDVFDGKYSLNCLEGYKENKSSEIKDLYNNRKTRRLGIISREMWTLKADNKPSVILLKDEVPQFYKGVFAGQFRYEVKDGVITKDLEQIAPITDICDAYTYYLLAERPFSIAEKEGTKNYAQYSSFR
jgi:hypothetical protein